MYRLPLRYCSFNSFANLWALNVKPCLSYHQTQLLLPTTATLEHVTLEMEGKAVPLRQLAQFGMPNQQMLVVNMASHPQVCLEQMHLEAFS